MDKIPMILVLLAGKYVHIATKTNKCWWFLMVTFLFQELENSFNYGLFQPPLNGRAGKFLDEERRLSEYPFQGSVGHLEVTWRFDLLILYQLFKIHYGHSNHTCILSAIYSYFQLKFKRRVYKMLNLDEKQLKSINSRTNLKKFLDNIRANNVDKIIKMCNKGLDPNFHCAETGGRLFQE